MIDCLIMGDSIAEGTKMFMPQCVAVAKSGINSKQFNSKFVYGHRDRGAEVVIISLGSNDVGIKTYNELYKLREHVRAERVYWVLPNPERFTRQANDVKLIAVSFGDTVIGTGKYSPDNVHPTNSGYKEIVGQVE